MNTLASLNIRAVGGKEGRIGTPYLVKMAVTTQKILKTERKYAGGPIS